VEKPSAMSDTESNVTDEQTYEQEVEILQTGVDELINEGHGKPDIVCRLGASRLGPWLGMNARGQIEGRTAAARMALQGKWSEPRKPSTGAPRPAPLAYGLVHERAAFDAYCKLDGIAPEDAVYQPGLRTWFGPTHTTNPMPFCVAAPDATIGDKGLLEIKCPYSMRDDPDRAVYLKPEWLLQVQLQMEAYNREWCDVVVWHESFLWIWRVNRDNSSVHKPYRSEQRKRAADGSMVLVPELQPATFLEVAWPEMCAFVNVPAEIGTERGNLPRINAEYRQMRDKCVFLRSTKEGSYVNLNAYSKYIGFNNPHVIHDAIHRFTNPLDSIYEGLDVEPRKQVLLNVRWVPNVDKVTRSGQYTEMKVFVWKPDGDPPPRGGWISQTYYTYVSYPKYQSMQRDCNDQSTMTVVPSIEIF
jgi:hypothetical protein